MGTVVIIGGGIIGTSIAYWLRSTAYDVHLYEKEMIGAGTTAKSAAMLTHHQETPNRETYEFREHAWKWYDEKIASDEFRFDQIGTLHLAKSKSELETIKEMQQSFASFGLALDILSPDEIADYNIRSDDLLGGLWFPDDGVLDPGEIVQFFAEHAREEGVQIETGVEVTDVTTTDGAVTGVETSEGFQQADVIINAAGPWAPQVNELLGINVPIRHTQGPILVLQADKPVSLPFTFFEEGVYIREESTSQSFAGKLATEYEKSQTVDPDHKHSIDESMYLQVAEVAETYLSEYPAFDIVNKWNGIRTVTPDGRAVVDETDVSGYLLACGMSGYGVTIAPAIGKFVSEWLSTGRKPEPLESLALKRFETAV